MSSLVFARFPIVLGGRWLQRGCQNSATGLRAGFCQGDLLGEPSRVQHRPPCTARTLSGTGDYLLVIYLASGPALRRWQLLSTEGLLW